MKKQERPVLVCLKCRQKFRSRCKKTHRICDVCAAKNRQQNVNYSWSNRVYKTPDQ